MSLITSHDGKYFFTGGFSDRVLQRSITTAEIIRTFKSDSSMINLLALSNDGKHLITGNIGCKVQVWDTKTATVLRSFQKKEMFFVTAAISFDSKYLVVAGMNGDIEVSELLSGKVICHFGEPTERKLPSLYMAGNGKYLITQLKDEPAIVWDMLKGKMLYKLNNTLKVSTVSSNANLLFICPEDGTLEVFDLEKQEIRECLMLPYENTPEIRSASDGKRLFIMYLWGTVEIIDLQEKAIVARIETGKECVPSFSFVNHHTFVIFYTIFGAELFDMGKRDTLWSIDYEDDEITTYVETRQTEIEFDIEPWVQEIWDWANEHGIPEDIVPRNRYDLLGLETLSLTVSDYDWWEDALTYLPKGLGYLDNLTSLEFSLFVETKNAIPKELGQLKHLEELYLDIYGEKDVIFELPKSMEKFRNLYKLYLDGNISSHSIDRILKNNPDLNTLAISNNALLKSIPKSICPSQALRTLKLKNTDNLILSQEQFKWAYKNLRGKVRDRSEMHSFYGYASDGSPISYDYELGTNFQYYSRIQL